MLQSKVLEIKITCGEYMITRTKEKKQTWYKLKNFRRIFGYSICYIRHWFSDMEMYGLFNKDKNKYSIADMEAFEKIIKQYKERLENA